MQPYTAFNLATYTNHIIIIRAYVKKWLLKTLLIFQINYNKKYTKSFGKKKIHVVLVGHHQYLHIVINYIYKYNITNQGMGGESDTTNQQLQSTQQYISTGATGYAGYVRQDTSVGHTLGHRLGHMLGDHSRQVHEESKILHRYSNEVCRQTDYILVYNNDNISLPHRT